MQPLSTTRASRPPLPRPCLSRLCRPASRALAGDAGGEHAAGGRRRRARRRACGRSCGRKRLAMPRVPQAARRMMVTAPRATREARKAQKVTTCRTRSARDAERRGARRARLWSGATGRRGRDT
eukprot:5008119-Pleurochrysis_carterae.AAC.3